MSRSVRVFIPFNTASFYGMERAVIEAFDAARPEIDAHFLVTRTAVRRGLPFVAELDRRGLAWSTFSDRGDWPRIGHPTSIVEAARMGVALLRGNRDVLRAARGFDALYLPSVGYAWFALAAMAAFRRRGKPVYHHFHDLPEAASSRLRLLNGLVTDHLHNTAAGRDAAIAAHPYLLKRRNHVVGCCVEMHADAPGAERVSDGWRDVVFLGRLAPEKGVRLLLDAFALVARRRSEARLHLVGSGNEHERNLIAEFAGRTGLSNRIVQWGWRPDAAAILAGAAIHVQPSLPSLRESFGRSAAEAMALGVPTVCLPSGVLPEVVGHEEAGLVCPEATAQSLAAALTRLLEDEPLRSRLAAQARVRWEQHYAPAAARRAWVACFRKEAV